MSSPGFDFQPDDHGFDFQADAAPAAPAVDSSKVPPEVQRAISSMPKPAPPPMSTVPLFERQPGTKYAAVPGSDAPEAQQVRLGNMVPDAAVPSLRVANKVAQFPVKMGEVAGEGFKDVMAGRTSLPLPERATGGVLPGSPMGPIERGVKSGAAESLGGIAGNPTSWPFFASGAAQPVLRQIINLGFRGMMAKSAVDAATTLHDNWEKLTPEQRANIATQGGISAYMAAGGGHLRDAMSKPYAAAPQGPESIFKSLVYNYTGKAVPESPTLAEATQLHRAALANLHPDVNPAHAEDATNLNQAWDAYKGTLSASTPAKVTPPATPQLPALTPQTIEGELAKNPATRDEIADAQAATNYAGPEQAKAAVVEKRQAAAAAVEGAATEKPPAVAAPPEAKPAPKPEPKAAPQTSAPAVIGEPIAKPRTEGQPLEHGFDFRPAEDVGQQARDAVQKDQGALPRGERRKIERTPEEQQTQTLFGQARKELGEDATSDQVMARVEELKKAPVDFKADQFKHRSTQVNIPEDSEAHQALETTRARISDSDLAGKGKDVGGNHVTVRWGLQAADDDKLEKIKQYLSSVPPFEAKLGKTEKFEPSESSEGAAVIQSPVEAPELKQIHDELAKHGDFTEPTFKDYKPHATVAYVKAEKADRYVGMSPTAGKMFPVNSIAVTDRQGKQEEVKLGGKSEAKPAPVLPQRSDEQAAAPAKTEKVGAATPERIEAGRDEILESELKQLKQQRADVMAQMVASSPYGEKAMELRTKHNDFLRKIQEREDELARLKGEPTRSEKRDLQTKEAEKSFAERPKEPLSYDDPKYSQHWQVLESDYIEKRFKDKAKTYERAITESKQEISESKSGTKKRSDALMNLEYRKSALEKFKAKDPRAAQSFKTEYNDLVKKAVSQGKPVPQAVIDQKPEFKLAQDARERYEKGRHTSFANKSAAINDTMQKDEGFKVKRQDGKPITDEQIKEISDGVSDVVKVLGEPLRDAMRGTDLTIAHTSGKHPFLSDAGGMYHPVDRTVSAGIEDFLGRPVKALAHELGHWFDFESGRAIGVRSRIYTKSGQSHVTQYQSESDSSKQLYELARRTMSDTREVSRMLKVTKLSDLADTERAEVERVKVVLGHYWREPRELFARMFEQYVADELGKPSTAAENIDRYYKTPAWWDKEAWAKLKPMMAQEIAKRFDALKERHSPAEVAAPAPAVSPTPEAKTTLKPRPAKGKREEIQPIIGATYKGRSGADIPYTVLEVVDHGPDDWRGKQVRVLRDGTEATFSANGIITGNDKLIKQPENAAAVPPTSDKPVAGVEKITPAEAQFEKDVKKRATTLRSEIATLKEQTSAPAAYFQDSAKNTAAHDERSRNIDRLSEAQKELDEIERAHPREVKPLDSSKLPDREKNKYGFQREYFTQSLQPVLDAWKAQLGPKFANAVKNGTKGVGAPAEFPERQVLVNIPGDGHFRVNNDPSVLDKVIRGASKGFANPGVGKGLKPISQRVSREPSEPAKWSYLERMADEAREGETQQEKDAALETIENILGKTPLKSLPKPGTTVEYRGEQFYVNGWDSDYKKLVNLIPADSDTGNQVGKWIKDGMPKLTTAESAVMSDRVRDVQESASLYLLQHVADPPEAKAKPSEEVVMGMFPGFDASKLADATRELFNQDVSPALSKAGIGIKETAGFFIKALYPRIEESSFLGRTVGVAAPTEAVDALMKLKGERTRALAEFDGIMHGLEKMFDRFPEAERVNFIDRLQTGKKQPTPELQQIGEAIQKIQADQRLQEQHAANLGRSPSQRVTLPEKENYFHNRWETPPGSGKAEDEETRISRLFTPRRPLEGSKSYNKQQSYTLKSGIAAGGRPVTTNPIRLLRLRIEDGMKFVTARRAWAQLGSLGLREFVPKGERMPEGFDPVDDRIARVYFPAETAKGNTVSVEGGQWAVESNTARLLNNMLSRDLIRANAVGRGLMWLKNASTALELGLSPFHAVFETIEAASSQLALGVLRSYNLGIRGADAGEFMTGLRQIMETPVAPITMAREGASLPAYVEARARLEKIGVTEFGQKQVEGKQPHGVLEAISHFREVRKQAGIQKLLKRYPDLDQLLDDMFTGGLVIGQHQDYQVKMMGKTASEAWTAGNPLGAMVRAIPAANQVIMKPLFQWYIPNLKYSLFLRQMSEQAAEHAADLESGALARAELARKVADSIENRFGELNFDNLFWNRTFKTAMQFAFRSVTWKLGNVRELGGAVAGQAKALGQWAWQANEMLSRAEHSADGKIEFPEPQPEKPGALPKLDQKASWLMSLVVTTAALGIILSKALTKKYPWEWADEAHKDDGSAERAKAIYLETVHPRTGELDSRGKPVRVSLPTYWKDVEHARANPAQYIMGSLSSTLGKGIDLAHNEDYFGNYVYNPNAALGTQLKQAGKYAFPEPFSISNFERGKQSGGTKTAWLSAFGFPKAPSDLDFTPAEKLARDLLKSREPRHTPEEMEEWQRKREAFEQGKMSGAEVHRYLKQQRGTWLQREVKQLTYGEAVRVMEKANDNERSSLHHVIAEKRMNVLKRGGYKKVEEAEEATR
jgi:2'-5' RNA ligase